MEKRRKGVVSQCVTLFISWQPVKFVRNLSRQSYLIKKLQAIATLPPETPVPEPRTEAKTPRANIIRSTMATIARITPRQPHLRSPSGSLSNKSVMIRPINGVVRIESRYAHPNPILLLAPSKPTSTDTSELVINPYKISVVAISQL